MVKMKWRRRLFPCMSNLNENEGGGGGGSVMKRNEGRSLLLLLSCGERREG
jgi:hypothetical protein